MPTINLTELAKIAIKIVLIGILASLIISYVSSITNTIFHVVSNMTDSVSSINGLNLGWFAGAIGLVDFLNALLQSLYVAGSIFISGVITIMGFKIGSKVYSNLLKV